MYKMVVQTRRRPGMSREAFRDYYESHHRHLVSHIAGHIVRYTRSYPVETIARNAGGFGRQPVGADTAYDVLTEIWVQDREGIDELFRLLGTSDATAAIAEDEPRFQDLSSKITMICEECESDLDEYRR